MKDVIDEREQQEPENAPLQERKEGMPLVGMDRATMIDTAGADAVLPRATKGTRNTSDMIFGIFVRFAVFIFMATLFGVLLVLVVQSIPSIQHSGLGFLVGTTWNPDEQIFGVLPAVVGTVFIAGIALFLAS